MNSRARWTAVIFAFVALNGTSIQLRGALLPAFETTFEVSPSVLGLIAPAGTVGFVMAVLGTGFAAGRLPIRRTLLVATVSVVGCLLATSVAPTYAVLLATVVVLGFATGAFRGLDRALLSHLYPDRRGEMFTRYDLAWACGAVTAPVVATVATATVGWRLSFVVLGIAFVPVAVTLARQESPERAADERRLSLAALADLRRSPAVVGMAVVLALVGGIEGGMFTWLPYYASESLPASIAPLTLSAYLLAYVPGRAVISTVASRVSYGRVALGLGIATVPIAYFALVIGSGLTLLVGVFALGAVISGLFPIVATIGVEAAPDYSGPINAIGTGASSVGIAAAPVLMGAVTDEWSIDTAMVVPVALSLVVVMALLALLVILSDRDS